MTLVRMLATTMLSLTAIANLSAQSAPAPLVVPPGGEAVSGTASPTAILTAPPTAANSYPPGTVVSPWCGEHGCVGPVGGNGPLTYELYAINGISLPVGGSPLSSAMKAGYMTGFTARTLWFDRDSTAACTLDLGLTYQYNRGQGDKTIAVNTPRIGPATIDPNTGALVAGVRLPDAPANYQLRAISRTNFNFSIGRDWWFQGPGNVNAQSPSNFCFGSDIGGHWGAGHVDLVPRLDPQNYFRKDGVTHGVMIGMHFDHERNMGNWTLISGFRAEWRYTITNLVPPLGGDIHDVNLLWTIGARF